MRRVPSFLLFVLLFSPAALADEWGSWRAPEVFLHWSDKADLHAVQLAPLPAEGRKSSMQCLAIALYKNEQVLKTYSADEIAAFIGLSGARLDHHDVFGRKRGFRELPDGRWGFEIEDFTGVPLMFDIETGELIENY